VEVTSLGFRTDLALLRLGGSEVTDHGDHLVVRSRHNPAFWWGNFLLLATVPTGAETDLWLERFAAEFPEASHLTLGFDGIDGRVADMAAFADQGLGCEASTVMTASTVTEPPRPNRDATCRPLRTDDDWAQSLVLEVAGNADQPASEFLKFIAPKVATNRAMTEAGHGAWFGAFLDDQLVAQLGLFAGGPALARFQAVITHPDFRGRGLAGTLVHHASGYGFAELNARTLVMVADPDDVAIRVYRSVGFTDSETQLQAERAPR
jgi:ribosomal protein S18 acetylase RimI-like enzyme